MRLRSVAATVALSLGLAFGGAGGAHAQAAPPADQAADSEQVARQHFQLGRAQYESGAFREAATSFEHAYELSKREVLWYNIFLAYRDAGDNAKAAEALRNYLTRVEQIDTRAQLEARLASLERLVQEEEQRKQQQAQQPSSEAAAQEPAQAETQQQQVANELTLHPTVKESPSIVPYILMGVGGAMIIGGVVTGAMASSKHGELEDQCPDNRCDDPSLKSVADEGETLALVADILLFGGIAAAGTGGVLWFLNNNQSSSEEAPVNAALSCGPRACGGRVGLRF
jgi:tetratricopeptide (TPR) repeat protein